MARDCFAPFTGGASLGPATEKVLICSCEDTMRLDVAAVERGCPNSEIAAFRQLCGKELDHFRAAARTRESLVVGCTQQAELFGEQAGERPERIEFVNVRESAGWSMRGSSRRAENGGPTGRRRRTYT